MNPTANIESATAINAGFKQTEVGWIPVDWEVKTLQNLTNLVIDGTHYTPKYTNRGIPFLRVTDIQNSDVPLTKLKYISNEEHQVLNKRCNPQKGDLLLSKNGTIGIPKVISWDWEFSIFVSLCLIKVREQELKVSLLEQMFKSHLFEIQLKQLSKQGTVTNLHLEDIRKLAFPLPPTLAEQNAIATALSDMDALIQAQEELLAKKRALKQGAMQELLRPKEGWVVKRLGEVGTFYKGKNVPKSELRTDGIPCVLYGEIYTEYHLLSYRLKSKTSETIAKDSFNLQNGDILFAGSGETASEIGKCFAYLSDEEGKPTTKGILRRAPRALTFACRSRQHAYSDAGLQFCGNSSCSLLTLWPWMRLSTSASHFSGSMPWCLQAAKKV
jgi:restriction endonuclease S subunit